MKLLTFLLVSLSVSASVFSQTTYTWTGSVNSNFSAAGNWNPTRQVGLTSDILVFNLGGNVNVINVNQVTIGQLLVRNNTNLTLSPSTGNSKTISINGCEGDDFAIESGSSLNISANSPSLNILVKTGANAVIFGELDFSGDANNNLNAVDSLSIRFKQGSVFSQLCPGNVFTSAGVNNAVVFENGSIFKLGHINALSPFGLLAPNSKVKFQQGSVFDYCVTNSSALSLSGRTYSNFIIESGVSITDNEVFAGPLNLDNLTINTNGSLNINNLSNQNVADINLKGNLVADGYVCFADTVSSIRNMALNFDGTGQQSIYGAGFISFSDLSVLRIINSITLYRDLTVNCPTSVEALINRNGHLFNFTLGSRTTTLPGKKIVNETNGNSSSQNQAQVPSAYSVSQNYPNPFNPSTKIDYALPFDSRVSIKVYDINGREVATIVDNNQNAGAYSVSFNASGLSSGACFYRISASGNGRNFTETKKMILVK